MQNLNNQKNNMKQTWKTLYEISNKQKGCRELPKCLFYINDLEVTDPSEMANDFKQYQI